MKTVGNITNNGRDLFYSVTAEDQPSELHGISGGKITKLSIEQDDKTVFEYNRGHITKAAAGEGIAEALAILIYKYN